MQMLQRTQQFSSVESTPLLAEPPFPLQMVKQLPAIHKCQDEIQLLCILKRELEGDDERIVDLCQNGSLG